MIYGTPTIVTNGLVLNLDVLNSKSNIPRNLLSYTTDLTNGTWGKLRCAITASAAIAPDGTNTAFAFNQSTGSNDLKRLNYTAGPPTAYNGGIFTYSLHVKQNNYSGSSGVQLGIYNSSQTAGTEPTFKPTSSFSNTDGSFTAGSGSIIDKGTINIGNGWYRIYATVTLTSSISNFSNFFDLDYGTITGSEYENTGIYIWGPQFENGYLSPYQSIIGNNYIWKDLSGNNNNGLLTGSFGLTQNSLIFNGTSSYVTASVPQSNSFTYNIWFNRAQSNREQHLIEYGNTQFYAGSNNKLGTATWIASPFGGVTTLQNNQWYNATLTRDSGSGVVSIYLNGQLENSTASLGTNPNVSKVWIGQFYNGGNYVFSGSIGYVQVYNRALSQQEIVQNYNALKTRFNLI